MASYNDFLTQQGNAGLASGGKYGYGQIPNPLDFMNQSGSSPLGSSAMQLPSSGADLSFGMNTPQQNFRMSEIGQQNLGAGALPNVSGSGLGFNMGTANLAFNGLSALTGLYTGLQGLKLAKQQFQFGKDMALRNEKNAVGDYNRNLEAQEGRKAITSGLTPAQGQANYERYKAVSA